MTSRHTVSGLLEQLARILGRSQAQQESRWMRDLAKTEDRLQLMLKRRISGEPVQYILGTQPFGPLELHVRPPVLIPRPETEDWTLRLAQRVSPTRQAPLKLLDLCTGTGCIPLLLCHLWPAGSVRTLAVDVASEAVALAKENADQVGVRVSEKKATRSEDNTISFLQADILQDNFPKILKELGWRSFDVLTSNPPYIPLDEYKALPSSVKDYEDLRALLGDPKLDVANDGRGLTFYRKIAELVRHQLVKPGGLIALEVGHDQSNEVEQIMLSDGRVQKTHVWKDPWGVPRTVVCLK
ncbi:S-adenosyl-L-methionine-dependent methyltransferase [Fomitiporia mediterranea MF3/22]|uniref:S-adenosyl-L-methionine-dependent methyltransferase n=1 Tax=Fomitiporia mediterranea (strain MF3/22) TaxID=694068 RepID=UPI00044095E5|nr:S-adenosyl-L-methionine-dependent methyltransferase [Fomitiporia mediterranea MF3/22]EJD02845.1 S-adenosyl-L-methionine-dependent methyltransferase [Fomitiporia mediterranea MF3/22]